MKKAVWGPRAMRSRSIVSIVAKFQKAPLPSLNTARLYFRPLVLNLVKTTRRVGSLVFLKQIFFTMLLTHCNPLSSSFTHFPTVHTYLKRVSASQSPFSFCFSHLSLFHFPLFTPHRPVLELWIELCNVELTNYCWWISPVSIEVCVWVCEKEVLTGDTFFIICYQSVKYRKIRAQMPRKGPNWREIFKDSKESKWRACQKEELSKTNDSWADYD